MNHQTPFFAPQPLCALFTPRLSLLVLNKLGVDEAAVVQAHLQGCEFCQLRLREYEMLRGALHRQFGAEQSVGQAHPAPTISRAARGRSLRRSSPSVFALEDIMRAANHQAQDTPPPTGHQPPKLPGPSPHTQVLSAFGAIAAVALIAILAGTLFALHRAPAHPATAPRAAPIVHVVSSSRQVQAGDATPTVATCPAGEVALSGGFAVPATGSVLASQRMGNGWGIVVQAPAGAGVPVTVSVTCLAHVPGATVQELSASVTVASGKYITNHVDCPSGASGAVGGGFATSSPQVTFDYFFLDMGSETTWVMEGTNSGPSAATSTVFVECLTASGVALAGAAMYDTAIPQGGEQTITAVCPTIPQGFFAGGGGVMVGPSSPTSSPQPVRLLSLAPANTARGWSADLSPMGGATIVDVYVWCLKFS